MPVSKKDVLKCTMTCKLSAKTQVLALSKNDNVG